MFATTAQGSWEGTSAASLKRNRSFIYHKVKQSKTWRVRTSNQGTWYRALSITTMQCCVACCGLITDMVWSRSGMVWEGVSSGQVWTRFPGIVCIDLVWPCLVWICLPSINNLFHSKMWHISLLPCIHPRRTGYLKDSSSCTPGPTTPLCSCCVWTCHSPVGLEQTFHRKVA